MLSTTGYQNAQKSIATEMTCNSLQIASGFWVFSRDLPHSSPYYGGIANPKVLSFVYSHRIVAQRYVDSEEGKFCTDLPCCSLSTACVTRSHEAADKSYHEDTILCPDTTSLWYQCQDPWDRGLLASLPPNNRLLSIDLHPYGASKRTLPHVQYLLFGVF